MFIFTNFIFLLTKVRLIRQTLSQNNFSIIFHRSAYISSNDIWERGGWDLTIRYIPFSILVLWYKLFSRPFYKSPWMWTSEPIVLYGYYWVDLVHSALGTSYTFQVVCQLTVNGNHFGSATQWLHQRFHHSAWLFPIKRHTTYVQHTINPLPMPFVVAACTALAGVAIYLIIYLWNSHPPRGNHPFPDCFLNWIYCT